MRADLPGALSHAGDVDEFDAALIRGAGGVPVEEQLESEQPLVEPQSNGEGPHEAEPAELVPAAGGGGRRGRGRSSAEDAFGEGAASEGAAPEAAPARKPKQSLPVRAVAFLRASWAELQRVQWPDRRQVTQATAVVLGFVAVAGAYLGVADWVAQKIINFIL
ncbi:MAG TPA: preprotein translocase subunit SecE [Solirubrobacteraceae bacterium]|nr:preprotein translocase subunit SecE [Solirubrobacteraceae bacterium]